MATRAPGKENIWKGPRKEWQRTVPRKKETGRSQFSDLIGRRRRSQSAFYRLYDIVRRYLLYSCARWRPTLQPPSTPEKIIPFPNSRQSLADPARCPPDAVS
jgi:hypothetical protein